MKVSSLGWRTVWPGLAGGVSGAIPVLLAAWGLTRFLEHDGLGEFAAAIAGAVVGGAMALAIQMVALNEARKARSDELAERRLAIGRAMLIKTLKMCSHFKQFEEYLSKALTAAPDKVDQFGAWSRVQGTANGPRKIEYNTDELSLLMALEDTELFNRIVMMDELHNATVDIFSFYSLKRDELVRQMPATMDGIEGTLELTEERQRILAPQMAMLNDLIDQMHKRAPEDTKSAFDVMTQLSVRLKDVGITQTISPKKV